ncbi:MAG: filamentous hemagglutinin N-terminal domain-containing protein [Gammaproteobacteria bacterium]|nr:filamentous hemagglutinin N-terminal domain-containing protein [Gammaproteobacteria bacterium]
MRSLLQWRCRRGGTLAFAIGVAMGSWTGAAAANPAGAQIVHGAVGMHMPNPATLEITNTPGAIINWQSFNIGINETTRFLQQNAASAVLNRVTGGNPSEILGTLQSNGRVFLINRNGILFGRDAVIDTAGLVASSLDMSDADFLAGRMQFEGDAAAGAVRNEGYIKAGPDGSVYLIAPNVVNAGIVETDGGEVLLAAGHSVTIVSLDSDSIAYQVDAPDTEAVNLGKLVTRGGAARIFAGTIRQAGTIDADSVSVDASGVIELRASQQVTLEAGSTTTARGPADGRGGRVEIGTLDGAADAALQVEHRGTIDVSGGSGGEVDIAADRVILGGSINADGEVDGGGVALSATTRLEADALTRVSANGTTGSGGRIAIDGGTELQSSALHSAQGDTGGTVHLLADEIVLEGALADARGTRGGGEIRVGGGFKGGEDLKAARSTTLDAYTRLRADAIEGGDGGTVAVWGAEETRFRGHISARGGFHSGDGGMVEVSGKALEFDGSVDVGALAGRAGTLLLDPKTVTIKPGGAAGNIIFSDPNPTAGGGFGNDFDCFAGGFFSGCNASADRILFYDPFDDLFGADSGAVYLFNMNSGALISTLTGAAAGDRVGSGGISTYPTGTAVLRSPSFNGNGGAFTPYNLTTGINGKVSNANSIIGNPGDFVVSSSFNFSFPNRLIMTNSNWGGGKGAATVLDRTTMKFIAGNSYGTVGAANSLVGASAGDLVGNGGIQYLSGSAVYVRSPSFNGNAGALTPFTATTAPTGVIGAANSIIGASAGDNLGSGGVDYYTVSGTALIFTSNFNGTRGAVTPVNPLTGRFKAGGGLGAIGAGNSLVGSAVGDFVGSGGIYNAGSGFVYSPGWNGNAGALTYYGATVTPVGPVAAGNSIIANPGENLGSGGIVTDAVPGRTLVATPAYGVNMGAITVLDNATGQFAAGGGFGLINSGNSVVGGSGDLVGNGGIVRTYFNTAFFYSSSWNGNAGALTFVSSTVTPTGLIDNTNSVFGNPGDSIGADEIDPFSLFGNTIVFSGFYNSDDGAVTVLDSATGQFVAGGGFGLVDQTNSFVGTIGASEGVGSGGSSDLWSLNGGGYLLQTSGFNAGAGAFTFFDFGTIPTGIIGAGNSIVGDAPGAGLGNGGIDTFTFFDKVVLTSPDALGTRGAVTMLDAFTGEFAVGGGLGAVSGANSLTGTLPGDAVGSGGLQQTNSGNLFVLSPNANSGGGALTFLSGTINPVGAVDNTNSILGGPGDDLLGAGLDIEPYALFGKTIVLSPSFGVSSGHGAVIVLDDTTGEFASGGGFGLVDNTNSLLGGNVGDAVGSGGLYFLDSGALLAYSPGWNGNAGAVSFFSNAVIPTGFVDNTNSVFGAAPGDRLASAGINTFTIPGRVALFSPNFGGGQGAISLLDSSTGQLVSGGGFGQIGVGNSLTGTALTDGVGGFASIFSLGASNFMFRIPSFNGGAGALTWFNSTTGIAGPVAIGNSLLGAAPGDAIGGGSTSLIFLTGSKYVLRSANFNGGRGAVTWFDAALGIAGTVGAGNSLVGSTASDGVGSAGVAVLDATRYAIYSPFWDNGAVVDAGAITYGLLASGVTGPVTVANSLVGDQASDRIGSSGAFGFVNLGASGNRYYRNSLWHNFAGALTLFRAGLAPPTGVVSATNSLVGSTASDQVASGSIQNPFGNRIMIFVSGWDNGAMVDAGAVVQTTTSGLVGTISATNSLVGTHGFDNVGSSGLASIGSGNFMIRSPNWNMGAGALTFVSPTTTPVGAVTATNSFVGATGGDGIANSIFTLYGTTKFAVSAPNWDNGALVDAGAFTIGDSAIGLFGMPTAAKSLIGTNAGDRVGSGGLTVDFGTFNFLLRSPNWNGATGAVTFVNPNLGISGQLSTANSLSGLNAGDLLGSGGVLSMGNDRFMVISPIADAIFNGATIDGAGRLDIVNGRTTGGGTATLGGSIGFATNPGGETAFGALDIAAFLNAGGALVLQADNDITIEPGAGIFAKGGSLTLQAGRSIIIKDSIDPETLFLLANQTGAAGFNPAYRDAGTGDIIIEAFNTAVRVEAKALTAAAQNILLIGGEATDAYAALVGLESLKVTADTLTLQVGTGANADAVLLAPAGVLELNAGVCEGCVDLAFNPLEDPVAQTGVFKGFPNVSIAIDSLLALGDGSAPAEGDENEDEDEEKKSRRMCR